VNVMSGGFTDLEVRLGWALDIVCPAHYLITRFSPSAASGTDSLALLWMAQIVANAAIWFGAGALITKMAGNQ